MSVQKFATVLKAQSEFQLNLMYELIGVNIGCLERMTASQLSSIKRLVERNSKLTSGDPNKPDYMYACCADIGNSLAEYWNGCSLQGLDYQHQFLQALLRQFAKCNSHPQRDGMTHQARS